MIEQWQWNASIDSSQADYSPSIATDNCGNVYVSGSGTNNTAPLYYNAGNLTDPANETGRTGSSTQIFIGKLSSTGVWQWNASIDSPQSDLTPSIATDNYGNVYVSGSGADSTAPLYYNPGNTGNIPNGTGRTVLVFKYSLGK